MVGGKPAFILAKDRCKVLHKGFLGGYQYRRMQVSGFEKYTEEPDKNRFSHPHDALQYAMSGIAGNTLIEPDENENEFQEPEVKHFKRRGKSRSTGY